MFRLSGKDEKNIMNILDKYLKHEEVQSMKKYIQHGRISTFDHCIKVAKISFWLNQRLRLNANEETLIIGAMLHDFYLYDWHEPGDGSHSFHGYKHPGTAVVNAYKHFGLSRKVLHIIESHMWPLTITKYPKSKEAAIVCFADKFCSLEEVIFER